MKRKFIVHKVTNCVWSVQGVGMNWGYPPVGVTCCNFIMDFNYCFDMLFNKVYILSRLLHSG